MHRSTASIAVLAGGRASRLGGAKAGVLLAGLPLIEHALGAARDAGMACVVVAKRGTALPAIGAPVLREPDEPHHPLCGIVAALDHALASSPAPALVVSACDMPFLTGPLLRWLAELDGAAVAELDGRLQPLPARVTSEHRGILADSLAGERPLGAALAELEPRLVSERELRRFGDPARLCFSVNDERELALAERWLA